MEPKNVVAIPYDLKIPENVLNDANVMKQLIRFMDILRELSKNSDCKLFKVIEEEIENQLLRADNIPVE